MQIKMKFYKKYNKLKKKMMIFKIKFKIQKNGKINKYIKSNMIMKLIKENKWNKELQNQHLNIQMKEIYIKDNQLKK